MKKIKTLLASMALMGLVGCGSSSSTDELTIPTYAAPTDAACNDQVQDVNWDKLLQANATKLSEYRLFQSQCNPTENPNTRGIPYDLSIPLFSDYTSKYRFVFVPSGEKIDYVEGEVFDFPEGSVLVKTFSMPSTTEKDSRGYAIENVIETRLLIHKSTGWVARVYTWDDNKLDATRETNGKSVATVLGHGDDIVQFNYGVPAQGQCTECHQYNPGGDKTQQIFSPIGPKARYLNSTYSYSTGDENQIQKWIADGILDGSTVPDASNREQAKQFNDYVDVDSIPPSEVETYATEWLDINCAHCHRLEGGASNTAFKAASTATFQGECEVPVSGAGTGSLVILPGSAESSLLYQRLHTTDPGLSMPPIGRNAIHTEGSALVKRWLDSLTGSCN
jgi:uncharacterized repeat protein (TIGR03806 family)